MRVSGNQASLNVNYPSPKQPNKKNEGVELQIQQQNLNKSTKNQSQKLQDLSKDNLDVASAQDIYNQELKEQHPLLLDPRTPRAIRG